MIKEAKVEDLEIIFKFIQKLVAYEKLEYLFKSSISDLKKYMFEEKLVHGLLIYDCEKPVGYALYFFTYSTFLGRPTLYVEDIFILEKHRKKGLGMQAFSYLANVAKNKECGRMEWSCLDWNKPSIDFYQNKIGAKVLSEWNLLRLTKEGIEKLGEYNE